MGEIGSLSSKFSLLTPTKEYEKSRISSSADIDRDEFQEIEDLLGLGPKSIENEVEMPETEQTNPDPDPGSDQKPDSKAKSQLDSEPNSDTSINQGQEETSPEDNAKNEQKEADDTSDLKKKLFELHKSHVGMFVEVLFVTI